ncbi:hypothetical protein DH2020_011934 [Rehmannia glutinosa]|uniref:Uncharacterized protein n=1 Tax=Rehmannia glutinosa TaxID=99300 RepID=A0ABR0XEW8_REHGL
MAIKTGMDKGRGRGNPSTTVVTSPKATNKKAKGPRKRWPRSTRWRSRRKPAKEVAVEEAAEMDEYWAGLWSGVDEELSWATCWCPFWEMEGIEDAYNALYDDVLWDYDIWDLKATANPPNP